MPSIRGSARAAPARRALTVRPGAIPEIIPPGAELVVGAMTRQNLVNPRSFTRLKAINDAGPVVAVLGRMRRHPTSFFRVAVVTTSLCFAGCSGQLGDDRETPTSGGSTGGGTDPAFQAASAGMHLLTVSQYRSTITDLLGPDLTIDVSGYTDVDVSLYHGFLSIGGSEAPFSQLAVQQFETTSADVARQVFADSARRTALVGCTPTSAADPCVEKFIRSFGRRVFRRPVTDGDRTRYQAIAEAGSAAPGDVWLGLESVLSAFLQSTSFLYRIELGESDPLMPGRRRYTSYEMASRLSYFVCGSTPDEELLDDAESGALVTTEGLEAQTKRLLETPAARAGLMRFFEEYLELRKVPGLAKDAALHPKASGTLMASMHTEMVKLLEDLVFDRNTDIRELYETNKTFVNAELADVYGLNKPSGSGFEAVSIPADWARGGFLTLGAFLATGGNEKTSSPTLRGKFIRVKLLCEAIPPPPPGVSTTLPAKPPGMKMTMRQRVAGHMSDDSCKGCHSRMDPLGLAFEHFDTIGMHRIDDDGLAIDTSGDLDGKPFQDAKELESLLRQDPRLPRCMTRELYRHATGHLEKAGEDGIIDGLAQQFGPSGNFRDLATHVISSDGFRYAGDPR